MRLSAKLVLSFAVIILITLCLGFFSVNRLNYLAERTHLLYRHPYAVSVAVAEIERDIVAVHRSMKDVALATDEAAMEAAYEVANSYEDTIMENF